MKKTKHCEGNCPHCGGTNVEYGTLNTFDVFSIYYPGHCEDCGKDFTEWYSIEYDETEYEEEDKEEQLDNGVS